MSLSQALVIRTVFRQATRSLLKLQRYFDRDQTVHRAAASGDILIARPNDHLIYNTFQSSYSQNSPTDASQASTQQQQPLDTTTSTPYEIQTLFYGEFLPSYFSDNASRLAGWKFEKEPPSDEFFDEIVTQFYEQYLPEEKYASRAEAAELLGFYSEFYSEFLYILGDDDEEEDDEEENDDEEYDEDYDNDDNGGVPAGRNLSNDSQLFDERWLMSQVESVGGSANFVRGTIANDWKTLIEEEYILEPHAVRSGVIVGESTEEEAQQSIIQQRNIDLGFSMLRKINKHCTFIESLVEDDLFEAKIRYLVHPDDGDKNENKNEDDIDMAVNIDSESRTENKNRKQQKELKFSVGQSLIHGRFGACVVLGWDRTCMATDEWCKDKKIDTRLAHGREQPFYNVLYEDDTKRYSEYCSQENLSLRPLNECHGPIQHKAVGYYFVDFDEGTGLHLLNKHLRKRYPEDEKASGADVLLDASSSHAPSAPINPQNDIDNHSTLEGDRIVRDGIKNFITLRKNR